MSLSDRLVALETATALDDAIKPVDAPPGWSPGIDWTPGKGGTLTTGPMTGEPDQAIWDVLIADWGLDPTKTEVIPGSVQVRGWDANIGGGVIQRMKYYKATLRDRTGTNDEQARIDCEALYKETRKAKKRTGSPKDGSATLFVAASDWQVGNMDGGGVERQVAAIAALPEQITQRLADMRRVGHQIGTVCLAGLGDLGEGTCGFYSAQQYRIEVDRRDQIKLVRRGLRDIIAEVAPKVPRMVVACVPGNHGENRQNGKAFTAPGDNDDVAVFEQVAEIMSTRPDLYGHIDWRIPRDEIAVSITLSGRIVALTHGHVPKPAGGPVNSMWKWWEAQAMGRAYPGVADADILVAGHFHHLNIKEQEKRALLIAPSLTPVSEYWSDANGTITRHGTLSFVIDHDGWGEMTLLR